MLGGLFAYLTAELKTALSRKFTIYAILAAGVALAVFAGGYLLDAVHSAIAFRLGATAASLIIAGGLVVLAVICVLVANGMQKSSGAVRRHDYDERPERPVAEGRWWPQRRRSMTRTAGVVGTLAGSALTGIAGAFALRRIQGGFGRFRGWFRR